MTLFGYRYFVGYLIDNRLGSHVLYFGLGIETQSMGKGGNEQSLHVIGNDEISLPD